MKSNHAANVLWSGFEAAVSAVLSFGSAFAVAHLVGPAEVGLGAAAVAVHVLLWIGVNALFADPIVQRSQVDQTVFASAWTASVVVGCGAALVQAACAVPLAWAYGDPRLIAMSLVLAAPLPLVGAAGPVQGLLTRERGYRQLAWRTLVGQGGGTVVGITAALGGAGAWALVAQQLVVSLAGALVLLLHCPLRLRLRINSLCLRELLQVGLPLTASTLVQHGRYRLFALLIGGSAGTAALGQVHMAFRLVDAVRELAFTAQWRLMLPFLSERQTDLRALHDAIDRCLAWSSAAAFPLCAVLAVAIQPLVGWLLGPTWEPAAEAALPLIGLTAWLFLAFPAGVGVIARGQPRYTLIANLGGTLATVAGVLLLRPATPLQAVLVWLAAQAFISPYILLANARVLEARPLRPLRAGLPLFAGWALAWAAAVLLPAMLGPPGSPEALLSLRLAILVTLGLPLTLAMAGPMMRNNGKIRRSRS